MSNMYPFTHPTGAGQSGVIRARESRRLTSGTATIWTLSGIVLAACNHSSNDNPATTVARSERAAVWLAAPRAEDADKTRVLLEFAYGDVDIDVGSTIAENLATEMHITDAEVRSNGNPGEAATFANAVAKGTIRVTEIDADGNQVLDANGNPTPVAGKLVLVDPVPRFDDGIFGDLNNNPPSLSAAGDDNVVQWGFTPSFREHLPEAGAEAKYVRMTFRFVPNDEDTYASPSIYMSFKIGGSQPVLYPVLRSEETEFTITLDGLAPTTGTFDASGTIEVVVDGIADDPIAGAGRFIVTSSLGENRGGGDGGYYGMFMIDQNTGDWSYNINDGPTPTPTLLATTGGRTVTEIISITYTPNIITGTNADYRLYQESNTINLVFTMMDQPVSNFVSEAYIDDTPIPDAPPALDVL